MACLGGPGPSYLAWHAPAKQDEQVAKETLNLNFIFSVKGAQSRDGWRMRSLD
jgi:hypothetical protein